jgi:hypothetical protein
MNASEGKGRTQLEHRIHFYLLGKRVLAEKVDASQIRSVSGHEVWSDQFLVPAAAFVADSCPLLDSLHVAPLVLQI